MPAPILVVQHGASVPPGWFAAAAGRAGFPLAISDPTTGDPIPDPAGHSAVVSLGGQMGAYEDAEHPWLQPERDLLAAAHDAGIPVLGICLGCQLLAAALGGSAYPGDGLEIGLLEITPTPAGAADPVLCHLDRPVPVTHGDTWEPPPGAELLAETDRYPHAFRTGHSLGIQSHPEVEPEVFAGWVRRRTEEELTAAGVDAAQLISAVRAQAAEQRSMALRMFGAWLDGIG